MQKTEITINLTDFPMELHPLFQRAMVYDSSCNPTMKVLYSDLGYYIKIAEKGRLEKEAKLAKLFAQMGMGPEVVSYLSENRDYLVTEAAKGEDALSYLDNPEGLCESLAEAMKYLHSRPIADVPVSGCMETYANYEKGSRLKQDTFIHGDFCLPNIMLTDGRFGSFIDVGLAGVGDRHIDLYWVLWSLNYNLGTDKYTDLFLECYGKENVDMEVLKIVAEVEAQT